LWQVSVGRWARIGAERASPTRVLALRNEAVLTPTTHANAANWAKSEQNNYHRLSRFIEEVEVGEQDSRIYNHRC
jgi:hypothetical protein